MSPEASRPRPVRAVLALALAALSPACLAESQPTGAPPSPPPVTQPPVTSPPTSDPGDPVVASSKARLRFLGGQRYARRLAAGLDLEVNELCRELGRFDCVDEAHNIVLGGVDAERLGFYEPLPGTTVTTPFAVDRVALSACIRAAQRDLGAPERAAIFALYPDADGRVPADDPALATAVQTLYVRLLQRRPAPEEAAAVRALYGDIERTESARPAADWAVASCLAVATTAEALFY